MMTMTSAMTDLINETCKRALGDHSPMGFQDRLHRHALDVSLELWDRTRNDFMVVEFLLEFRIWARSQS